MKAPGKLTNKMVKHGNLNMLVWIPRHTDYLRFKMWIDSDQRHEFKLFIMWIPIEREPIYFCLGWIWFNKILVKGTECQRRTYIGVIFTGQLKCKWHHPNRHQTLEKRPTCYIHTCTLKYAPYRWGGFLLIGVKSASIVCDWNIQ